MGLFDFDKMKEPVFLKETSSAKEQLNQLNALKETASANVKTQIEQDIKLLSAGVYGEDNIIYELKNSHIPMYIIHDLYLENDGLTAQIDFLIVTRKCVFVIECKNLFGDIEINNNGDFIRAIQIGGRHIKEGIYSPYTQNKRHLELIKAIRLKTKTNFITRSLFSSNFDSTYRSLIVLANPKTVVNMKYAKKEIKQHVVRADQLVEYIREIDNDSKIESWSDKQMTELAEFYLSQHKENTVDYLEKYKVVEAEVNTPVESVPEPVILTEVSDDKKEELRKALKAFRLSQSRKENIKAYYIFNDKQMEELIEKLPKDANGLLNVSGFGPAKCEKYGIEILKIISDFLN